MPPLVPPSSSVPIPLPSTPSFAGIQLPSDRFSGYNLLLSYHLSPRDQSTLFGTSIEVPLPRPFSLSHACVSVSDWLCSCLHDNLVQSRRGFSAKVRSHRSPYCNSQTPEYA